MRLITAEGAILEHILDESFSIWSMGLTRHAYGLWNATQQRTAWGRTHLQRVALVSDTGELLSSAKRYRLTARVDDDQIRVCGIGAVFTPVAMRGRGHATTLIDRMIDEERRHGAQMAALFSEIGTRFYERLGFTAVPLDEVTVHVALKRGGSPAMLVRAGDDRDLDAVAAMHDTRAAATRFSLRRDPSQIQFSLTRKRALAGLGPDGLRQVEFFVAEEGASAVAYVVLSVNANGWTLEEAGDRDPAGARLGALLHVLIAREPSRTAPLIRTWWPAGLAVPPQLSLTDRSDARDVFMLRALGDVEVPSSADVFYWRSDEF